jgi:peptidyl-prolyl cis-trans isomerase B (cyclophilin B)
MYRHIVLTAICIILFIAGPALAKEKPLVQMETSMGTVLVELDAQAAPITVANFIAYVKAGFYDNTIFHRVIKAFMIQGGGFDKEMQKKETRPPIQNEADNGLMNLSGTIAMARTNAPHSATAQFFINVKDNPFLNHRSKTPNGWGYCVFGRVVKGMEVVRAVENVPTTIRSGYRDVPVKPVVIKRMALVDAQK